MFSILSSLPRTWYYIKQLRETIALNFVLEVVEYPRNKEKTTLTHDGERILIHSCFAYENSTFQVQDYIANASYIDK